MALSTQHNTMREISVYVTKHSKDLVCTHSKHAKRAIHMLQHLLKSAILNSSMCVDMIESTLLSRYIHVTYSLT